MDKVKSGDILGRTLIDNKGNTLLRAGAELKPKLLDKIIEFNYGGLYIEDEISSDIHLDDFIPLDLKLKAFKALQNKQYELVCSLAKKFVEELMHQESLAINIIDIKNMENYTINHSINVCVDSIIMGIAMNMTTEELENLAVAAILADVGKYDISNDIWHKKGPLTPAEYNEVKQHPKIAFEKLKAYPFISPISRNAILFSHENLDGSGYYGKKADEIRLTSRIIHLIDTFDALTSVRKYRPAYSIKESIEFLMGSANQYDEKLLKIMSSLFPIYPIGLTVKLSDGKTAVIKNNEHNALRPIVRIMETDELIDLSDNLKYRNVVIQDIDR